MTICIGFYLYRPEMTDDSVWRTGALIVAIDAGLVVLERYTGTAAAVSTASRINLASVKTGLFAE